jgi:hypothetical protein
VDTIARAHGGRCTVAPNGGDGGAVTTFALRLPGFRADRERAEALQAIGS